jgi:hypothetical protein
MSQHEKEECIGTHNCNMCGMMISKEEIRTNTHNCFKNLAEYLTTLVEEKDLVIELFRDELNRKNKLILQFIEKQTLLEARLHKIEEILHYDSTVDEETNG